MQRVYNQRKVNHATCKKVKGWDWSVQTQLETQMFFGVVPIGGAIVHPRWWRLQPTKGNGCTSPRRAPPMKKQPCLSHHGHHPRRTCLTRVDLHEVGDTSPSYLLFQTLLTFFWTLTCMIWMELTPTDAVFSRIAMVLFMCRKKSSRNDLKLHGTSIRKI